MNNIREKALAFATKAHEGQFRKDGKTPYINHPIAVAGFAEDIWKSYGFNDENDLENIISIALLHDTIEDTEVTYEDLVSEFGNAIADAVKCLTRRKDETYFDMVIRLLNSGSVGIAIVKLADHKHNMFDLNEGSLKDKYRFSEYIINKALEGKLDFED